jgi:YD repeat-containing protein
MKQKHLANAQSIKGKIFIPILLLLTIISAAHGQTVSFDYDADGNMESRYVATLRSAETVEEEEEETPVPGIEFFERKITIYPNPTQGQISIKITPSIPEEDSFLRLYDMGGRLIKSQKIESVLTEMKITGNPGIYLLNIHLNGEVSKWKIIKQ